LKLDATFHDDVGRLVIAHFSDPSCDSSPFQVVNIYGPNRRHLGEDFFTSILSQIDPSLPTFLCGDFNTVVDRHIDRRGCNPSSYWSYNWPQSLSLLTSQLDLVDAWRRCHPTDRHFTWHRPCGSQASRLDMVWISSHLLEHVHQVDILPFFRSDHSYVFLRISLPSMPKRGPGTWKFNSSLLTDDDYIDQVRVFWQMWQQEKASFPSLAVWWDAGKKRIKDVSRTFVSRKARARRVRIKSLENCLFHLERRKHNGDDVDALISQTKTDIELELLHTAAGAKICAKEKWAEEGETSSKYFLRMEKSRAIKKVFTGIKNAQNVVVRSISAIIRVWILFYVQLFTASVLVPSDQDFFINSLDLSLSRADADLCDGVITEAEYSQAISQMSKNKSPGIDGLPYEFYSCFWSILGTDLVSVYNHNFLSGRLSFSQRTGLITLLYKKGDRLETKNWSPISLLCTDYKILAKVLTNRLLLVLPSVVHPDQTCGVPGRFSSENVRVLQDIINHANQADSAAAIISLDQEKAFDHVDWSFMLRVLEQMNFGVSFRSWVKLLYTEIFSTVLVNDYVSELFPVTRGVRQGCPLSPLLYVLVAETIAGAIRKDSSIDGFLLPDGRRTKVFQYADDTSILVQSDNSIRALFSLFDRYERASGAKLNVTKSHGLLIGSWKHRTDLPVPLNWSNVSITVLGCRLGNDLSVDWDSLITKFEDQLRLWKSRQLSFRGRALIANVLGLSAFWYQATIFDVPKLIVHRINKLLFPFVWNKKKEWMARSSVTQPLAAGGLGVVDVLRKISSLRAVWLRRYFSGPVHHPWSSFFEYHISSVFPNHDVASLFACDTIPAYRIKRLPPFYASLVRAWVDLKGTRDGQRWIGPRPGVDPLPIDQVSARISYSLLSQYQHVEHRSVVKFSDLGISVNWKEAWISLRLWRFVRSIQDTSSLSFHGILPTADRLVRFGMNVNPLCFCGQPETLLHLFTICPFGTAIIDWLLVLLRRSKPTAVFNDAEILFGFTATSRVPVVFTALLGILRHHIWLARNRHRFDNVPPDVSETMRKARSTFRFLVRMHRRHCRSPEQFDNEWLVNGIVGSITEQGWIRFNHDFIT
jgi:hypothetical protein